MSAKFILGLSCVWRRHRIARYISDTMPAPPIAVPRDFTVAEVARALGVAQQRFRAMVDAGNGPPATRLGKGRLPFRDDVLAAWLAERGHAPGCLIGERRLRWRWPLRCRLAGAGLAARR